MSLIEQVGTYLSTVTHFQVAFIASFLCTLGFLCVHWFIPRLRQLDSFNDGILNSVGAGLALGYVFLFAMPSFLVQIPKLAQNARFFFFQSQRNFLFITFFIVLIGFFQVYILDKIAHRQTKKGLEPTHVIYISHLAQITFSSFSITVVMQTMAEQSIAALFLFSLVMIFYFGLNDHALTHRFPNRFDHKGRLWPMLGVLSGWVIGTFILHGHPSVFVVLLKAYLAGVILINSAKNEFSMIEDHSHFPAFATSLGLKAFIVLLMFILDGR